MKTKAKAKAKAKAGDPVTDGWASRVIAGESARAIAEEEGVTYATFAATMAGAGNSLRRCKARRRDAILARHGEGHTPEEIAAAFGVQARTVKRMVLESRAGDGRGLPRISVKSLAIVAQLFDPSRSLTEIARASGVSVQWVSHLYRTALAEGVPFPERGPQDAEKNTVS